MKRQECTVASTTDRLLTERLDDLMQRLAATDGVLPAVAIAELARLIGAVSSLRETHSVDPRGRCHVCRDHRLASRRQQCTVYLTLDYFLGPQPGLSTTGDAHPSWHDR